MGAAEDTSPEACAGAVSEVRVCDICGAAGYGEFLTVCTQCSERVEHIYCMQALCDSVPANWVCEGCQKRLHNETHEEKNKRLLPKINLKNENIKTPLSCQETELQNEQCVCGQEEDEVQKRIPPVQGKEREEVRDGTYAKIIPSETLSMSVLTENILQSNAGDVKAGCEMASSQDRVNLERLHHGPKGLASSKLLSCANHGLSKSNLPDSDPVPSFLLPSRPKELRRSNSRYSSVVANKKAGLPPNRVKVTADVHNEHVGNEASLSASGLGMETSWQQSCKNFSHKSQGGMTVKADWKCGHMNSSEIAHQSKDFPGNEKDMFCIESFKARQPAKEKEAVVMETTSLGKVGSFGSKQSVPEMRKSLEMVHAGTLKRPLNLSKKGILEIPALSHQDLLAMQLNVPSGTPRYHAPQPPVSQGGSLAVSNEWQFQPKGFNPLLARPCRPYGQDFNISSQGIDRAYGLNVNNGYYPPPQLQAIPHVQKVWRGCFNVSTSANCSVVYDGIQAHFSNKADPKVWEAAQSLPGLLRMKELKRGLDNNTWPQHFLDSPPTSDSIGMFFFPVDMESHDSFYKPLADRLIAYDLVLRAESASLYLLIFHSQLLPLAEQLWSGRHYLWGVFRTKKSKSIERAIIVQSAVDANKSASLNVNGDIVDMDIDMVGGIDVQPSTSPGREPSLPPLPPGSPPARPSPPPTPPHHSDEDMDVSLCSRSLPSAPPSPPPTPPQSQQEIVLESSCDISDIPKHRPAAQQNVCSPSNTLQSLLGGENKRPQPTLDLGNGILSSKKSRLEGMGSDMSVGAAEPRRRGKFSAFSLKGHHGEAKSPILSLISADDHPEPPSLQDGVTSAAGESTQWILQTSEGQKLEENVKATTNPILQYHHPT